MGSFKRFIGILIEQYAGDFPLWLAPIQAAAITLEKHAEKNKEITIFLKIKTWINSDLRNEKTLIKSATTLCGVPSSWFLYIKTESSTL